MRILCFFPNYHSWVEFTNTKIFKILSRFAVWLGQWWALPDQKGCIQILLQWIWVNSYTTSLLAEKGVQELKEQTQFIGKQVLAKTVGTCPFQALALAETVSCRADLPGGKLQAVRWERGLTRASALEKGAVTQNSPVSVQLWGPCALSFKHS